MSFQEIQPQKTKAMYVTEQILTAIRRGEYPEGSQLPSERVISTQMKVSRNSVREALSALQIIGIVESRTGEGTYVRDPVLDKADIRNVLLELKEGEDLLEIWEARREIESSLVKLAIERISETQLHAMRVIIINMQKTIEAKDVDGYLIENHNFHLALAEAADNIPLKKALCALMKLTTQQLSEDVNVGYVLKSMEKSLIEHENIYRGIEKGDKVATVKAIRIHFKELENYFKSEYAASGRG